MSFQLVEMYVIWLVFYGVVGWLYESFICSVDARKWINRGFLNGPYCPIYGFGAVFDILLLGHIQNPVALFFLGVVVTCSLEYLTSYLMEKLFHARWWDYSERKFNINGRVCLLGAVVFGLFSVVLIKVIHPIVVYYTELLPAWAIHCLAAFLFLGVAVDTIVTVGGFAGFNERLKEFESAVEQAKAESPRYQELSANLERLKEEAGENLRTALAAEKRKVSLVVVRGEYRPFANGLNGQQRRMLKAFPHLRSVSHNNALKDLREALKNLDLKDKLEEKKEALETKLDSKKEEISMMIDTKKDALENRLTSQKELLDTKLEQKKEEMHRKKE